MSISGSYTQQGEGRCERKRLTSVKEQKHKRERDWKSKSRVKQAMRSEKEDIGPALYGRATIDARDE